jgi:hemerythrin-like metal-binding protein
MAYRKIEWTDDLRLDVEALDNDHRKLISLMNAMSAACFTGVEDYILNKVMAELVDYTHSHFVREEASMEHHGYGGLAEHRQEHRKLIAQLDGILAQVKAAGQVGMGGELMDLLSEWVIRHILESDRRFADFLKATGG